MSFGWGVNRSFTEVELKQIEVVIKDINYFVVDHKLSMDDNGITFGYGTSKLDLAISDEEGIFYLEKCKCFYNECLAFKILLLYIHNVFPLSIFVITANSDWVEPKRMLDIILLSIDTTDTNSDKFSYLQLE